MDTKNNSLDKFLFKNFPAKFPERNGVLQNNPRVIYHYTSVDVFEKMLHDDSDFYLSESSLLNDRKELYAGIEFLYRYQRDKGRELFAGLPECFVLEYVGNPTEEPWVMCFSSDADSLGQWISYTDRQNGGVAVGFDIDELFNRVKNGHEGWGAVGVERENRQYSFSCSHSVNSRKANQPFCACLCRKIGVSNDQLISMPHITQHLQEVAG